MLVHSHWSIGPTTSLITVVSILCAGVLASIVRGGGEAGVSGDSGRLKSA